MHTRRTAILPILAICTTVLADIPSPNREHTVQSANEAFVAVVSPAGHHYQDQVGTTTVSRLGAGGTRTELYTAPFFCWDPELSNNGKVLIQWGPWATDQAEMTDLALAIWREGRKLHEYRVCDLIQDRSKLDMTVSHYSWRASRQSIDDGFTDDSAYFTIVLCDRQWIRFNTETGQISDVGVDESARNWIEIREEEEAAGEAGAKRRLESSAQWKPFAESMEVQKLQYSKGTFWGGCYLETASILIRCTPHRPDLTLGIFEFAFVPLGADDVEIGVTPEACIAAMEEIMRLEPFASDIEAGRVESVRLRIAGDRLHWDTEEIEEWRKRAERPEDHWPESALWCQAIVTYGERDYFTVYHPCGTNVLLFHARDAQKSPTISRLASESGEGAANAYDWQDVLVLDQDGTLRLANR